MSEFHFIFLICFLCCSSIENVIPFFCVFLVLLSTRLGFFYISHRWCCVPIRRHRNIICFLYTTWWKICWHVSEILTRKTSLSVLWTSRTIFSALILGNFHVFGNANIFTDISFIAESIEFEKRIFWIFYFINEYRILVISIT